jgi:4-hydroxybenzoate polyprenyltransferase
MRFIIGLLKLLEGLMLFYLVFWILGWYIKGHFSKHFIFFWIFSALCMFVYFNHQQEVKNSYDPRSGQEIWTENMKDYDAARGY